MPIGAGRSELETRRDAVNGDVREPGDEMRFSRRERLWLWAVALVGLLGVNGAFLYGFIFRPALVDAAMANPVSAAFMAEAMILVALLAYLFARWGVSRIRWPWFVVLSLLGSLLFAIPVALLAGGSRGPAPAERGSGGGHR